MKIKKDHDYDQETVRLIEEAERKVQEAHNEATVAKQRATVAKKEWELAIEELHLLIRERRDGPEPNLFDTSITAPDESQVRADLWKRFPIDAKHWKGFGLTARDIQAINEGKTAHGTFPLLTLGDISLFTTPDQNGFSRSLVDIKGIGETAYARWCSAHEEFWAWWKDKGQEEFWGEIGPKEADQPEAKTDGEVNPEPKKRKRHPELGEDPGTDTDNQSSSGNNEG